MKLRVTALTVIAASFTGLSFAADWPNWRGPNQDGSSPEKGLPDKLSKTENVKWSVATPGLSASVPVVSGGKVFLSAPINDEKKLVALCYDAKTGKELWRNVGRSPERAGSAKRPFNHASSVRPISNAMATKRKNT